VVRCLLLTGHVRSFAECKDSILKTFCDENTDIYACTWNDQGYYSLSERFNIPIKRELILPPKEVDRFVPIDRHNDIFKTSFISELHLRIGWVERLKLQWYCVKKGFELLDNYSQYDTIIRCRFDLKFSGEPLCFEPNDNLNTPAPVNVDGTKCIINRQEYTELYACDVEKRLNPGRWLYNDHLAWGNPYVMKKYCNLFDHIDGIYEMHNVDISHAERMLDFYITNTFPLLKTNFHEFEYELIKPHNDQTRIKY
tara:strand:+ start:1045 stop:1806 length:762 start_codon:yes stop_codon:yes gene_type:complete